MHWLAIAGLGVWIWLLWRRLREVTQQLEDTCDRLDALEWRLREAAPQPEPAPHPAPQNVQRPFVVVPPPAPEPQTAPPAEPASIFTRAEEEEPLELSLEAVLAPKRSARSLEQWLSENGLVWIGGGVIALGGVLLVAFAVQQGLLTPGMRVIAALVLGAALIGLGEWARGAAARDAARGHPLAGAILAGAGAAILYAATWSAHGLFHFIGWGVAALALSACSALLLALSLRHSQALAGLALAFAFLAPALTSMGDWPSAALTLYLLIVTIAGFAVASWRGWIAAAGVSMLGAYLWFAASLADEAHLRGAVLLVLSALGVCVAAQRHALEPARAAPEWIEARAMLPSIGVSLSAALVLFDWAAVGNSLTAYPMVAAPALAAMGVAGLAAAARRADLIDPIAAMGAIGAMPIGAAVYANVRANIAPPDATFIAWCFALAGAAMLCGLAAARGGDGRARIAAAGGVSALAAMMLGASLAPSWSALSAWAPLIIGAALLWRCAHFAAREAPESDLSVDVWAGVGAVALLLALNLSTPPLFKPIANGAAACVFASLFVREGWRVWPHAALVTALVTLASILSGHVTGLALIGRPDMWAALAAIGATAGLLFAASLILRRRSAESTHADALSAGAIIAALLGGFLITRWIAGGGAGQAVDEFTGRALHALVLLAGGFLCTPRPGLSVGLITRWRGHVLMGLGAAYALFGVGMTHNPWWGGTPEPIAGAPLLNMLALAFAAPAALLFLSARRFYLSSRVTARIYLGLGGVFATLWALLEIRRAFHGATLSGAAVGLGEGCAYALAALIGAGVTALIARRRAASASRPFTADLARASDAASLGALAFAALLLLALRNAWWGGQPSENGALETAFGVLAHLIAALLCLGLALYARHNLGRRICLAASAIFAISFGALAIRWDHHHAAMDDGAAFAGLEGLWLALWPLAATSAALWLTPRLALKQRFAWLRPLEEQMLQVWRGALWPALVFAIAGLGLLYPPWWGLFPAQFESPLLALAGGAIYLAAAALAARCTRAQSAPAPRVFAQVSTAAAFAALFALVTIGVRYAFHGAAMEIDSDNANLETWTFSAAWVLFGAGALMLGVLRANTTLRWCGLALLLITVAKVLLVDMAQLDMLIRVASLLVVGSVLVGAAMARRRLATR